MKDIIKELWYGNVCPQTDSRTNSNQMKIVMGYIINNQEKLTATLSEEEKDILKKFDECWSEYLSLAEEAIFCYAFKLGMRLAIDTLII